MQTIRYLSIAMSLIAAVPIHSAMGDDRGLTNTANSPHAQFGTVGIDDVRWTDGFWADRFERCQADMLLHMWDVYMQHGFQNFRAVAGDIGGEFWGTWWMDGDFYKWLEATAWVYGQTKDPQLDRQMDEIIEVIARAQHQNGYLHTALQLGRGERLKRVKATRRVQDLADRRWSSSTFHEVYNFGHLITAGCVHYRATGKRNLLDVAIKAADHLDTVFSVDDPELDLVTGNPPHIMGLVELYRTIDEPKYLRLAQTILDRRGTSGGGTEHRQNQAPFRQLEVATGHAVFGTYLYSGATDVYLETGDAAIWQTLERLWNDVASKRLYVTGACTAIHYSVTQDRRHPTHEAFGWDYELPSATAYNETCANIGNAMWNWRMLTASGDARYADLMERVFYNSLLSAINLDGKKYFYANVLRWYGPDHRLLSHDYHERQDEGLDCICCPPNIVRTIAEMNNYAYGIAKNELWVHLYGSNKLATQLPDGGEVSLRQESDYPWDGKVRITVEKTPDSLEAIRLRIPGWAKGATAAVNGSAVDGVEPGSYLNLRQGWKSGDVIELDLAMSVRLVEGHPKVEETRNQVAVLRGPLVYCLESIDLPDGIHVSDVLLPLEHDLKPKYHGDLLDGVAILEGNADRLPHRDWGAELYQEIQPQPLQRLPVRLIPYYARCNRGQCEMSVWLPVNR